MQQPTNSRKKFLRWGAALAVSLTALHFWGRSKKAPPTVAGNKVKMLTQDGKLVEIDQSLLAASQQKVTNEELQQWIKK